MNRLRNLTFLFVLFFYLTSCGEQPRTFVPNAVDSFTVHSQDSYTQATALLQADFVFVMDYSWSMSTGPYGSKKDKILSSMSNFVSELLSRNVDYRIGIINGNVQYNNTQYLASDFQNSLVLDRQSSNSLHSSVLNQIQNLGDPLQPNTTLLLEAAKNVLTTQNNFIRPGSQLVLVFASDTDDQSNQYFGGSTSHYTQQLSALKPSQHLVNAVTIGTHSNQGCAPDTHTYYERNADRLLNVSLGLNAGTINSFYCIRTPSSTMAQNLVNLARNVKSPTRVFELRSKAVEESSIQVFVREQGSGTFVEKFRNSDWQLISTNNATAIEFFNGREPSPNASVRITYNPYFKLSSVPQLSTLSVNLNNSVVQQSSSSGWSYDAASNTIRFNGISLPNGSKVNINYQ